MKPFKRGDKGWRSDRTRADEKADDALMADEAAEGRPWSDDAYDARRRRLQDFDRHMRE